LFKIAVLVSGGGSNLQSIIDNIDNGYLKNLIIDYVISDKTNVFAIERAKKAGIKTLILEKSQFKEKLSDEIHGVLSGKVDLIVLAGFLSVIKGALMEEFKNKIINVHPSLIPSFCGKGMYGLRVHQAAIDYGVKLSGCTVHFVDEHTDTGAIILQNSVEVYPADTPETLQERVLKEEHKMLPKAIKLIAEGKVTVIGRKVIVKE
jgi:phosphoribosylglycinamide formyltransferase 1